MLGGGWVTGSAGRSMPRSLRAGHRSGGSGSAPARDEVFSPGGQPRLRRCRRDAGGNEAVTPAGDVGDVSGPIRPAPQGLSQGRQMHPRSAWTDPDIGPYVSDEFLVLHDLTCALHENSEDVEGPAAERDRKTVPPQRSLGEVQLERAEHERLHARETGQRGVWPMVGLPHGPPPSRWPTALIGLDPRGECSHCQLRDTVGQGN